ncbi:MAG: cupin domain-containing protein [Myxococcales bacterium]|nr:cupin domain-containing protein [Myxococcales bacterium]
MPPKIRQRLFRSRPRLIRGAGRERLTAEHCFIRQLWGLPADRTLSVARARVRPGVITAWHTLDRTCEWYLIFSGTGRVEVGRARPRRVGPGDLVFIPPDTRQRITNVGRRDLVFYCLCQPAFSPSCYHSGERSHPRHKRGDP